MSAPGGLIRTQWENFRALCLPDDAPAVQVREMRRAFYAGVDCIIVKIMHDLSEGPDVEDRDIELMEGIEAELQAFSQNIKDGVA